MNPDQIVIAARGWLGTPFKHQGRIRNVGVDCAGLIVGVALELGLAVRDMQGYGREPRSGLLQKQLAEQLVRIYQPELGSVILMRFASEPQHLGIIGSDSNDRFTLIHAYQNVGKCVEHRYCDMWRKRTAAIYKFPEVDNG